MVCEVQQWRSGASEPTGSKRMESRAVFVGKVGGTRLYVARRRLSRSEQSIRGEEVSLDAEMARPRFASHSLRLAAGHVYWREGRAEGRAGSSLRPSLMRKFVSFLTVTRADSQHECSAGNGSKSTCIRMKRGFFDAYA